MIANCKERKMKVHVALACLSAAVPALALDCSVAALQPVVGDSLGTATVLSAVHLGANSTFGELGDGAYPRNATNLPASCVVTVNVTSSPTSSYRFGLMLPDDWNMRYLAVGLGGFLGIQRYPMISPLLMTNSPSKRRHQLAGHGCWTSLWLRSHVYRHRT